MSTHGNVAKGVIGTVIVIAIAITLVRASVTTLAGTIVIMFLVLRMRTLTRNLRRLDLSVILGVSSTNVVENFISKRFGTPAKRYTVLRELERSNYDLFLSQETHVSTGRLTDEIAHCCPGQFFWSFGRGKSAGLALFVSPRFLGRICRFFFDSDGRILSGDYLP